MNDSAPNKTDVIYFPPKTLLCSESLYFFLSDFHDVVGSFFFLIELISYADSAVERAAKVLMETAQTQEDREKYKKQLEKKDRALNKSKKYSHVNSRNIFTATVDHFLWYFSSIIQAAIKRKPDILRSSETLRIEEILDYKKRSDLVSFIIDKKINALSYGGLREMEKYVGERLGVAIFNDDEKRKLMNIYIELRNVHVHNRGYINRTFLSKAPLHPDFDFKSGTRFHLDYNGIVRMSEVCLKTAIEFDSIVCEKFKIQRKKYKTWHSIIRKESD